MEAKEDESSFDSLLGRNWWKVAGSGVTRGRFDTAVFRRYEDSIRDVLSKGEGGGGAEADAEGKDEGKGKGKDVAEDVHCWATYNPEHRKHKRKTPTSTSYDVAVVQEFNPGGFHFAKAKAAEVVMMLSDKDGGIVVDKPTKYEGCVGDVEGDHAVLINVSPLVECHALVVPHVKKQLPQVIVREGLQVAVATCRLSTRPDLCLCFNSLGAWASVNHLHFHTLYSRDVWGGGAKDGIRKGSKGSGPGKTPLETADSTTIRDVEGERVTISHVTGWPIPGYHFQARELPGGQSELVDVVIKFVKQLQSNNTPHQLLVTRNGGSIFVLPRKPQAHSKLADPVGCIQIAIAESLGLAIWYDEDAYKSQPLETYAKIMQEAALDADSHKDLVSFLTT